jgi:SAM-dependent methyltransferase
LEKALATGDPAVEFIHQNVTAPRLRQRKIAGALTPVTTIDASSGEVAGQYEAHPYPAWIGEPADSVQLPPPVRSALGPGGREAIHSVLVAGCGTGEHAAVAARAWPRADILAIDISRTSLAYAMDRLQGETRERIHFELADLLKVEQLGRRFQVIETMGVLHHLADPEAGLRALTQVLEPGGIIGIGLYSAAARTKLAAVGKRFDDQDMKSDEAVRRFRAWALAELKAPELLHSPDFYSIGGCRDAFFHVREHCYSLEQIGEMLDRSGLRLLAVQTPPMAEERLGTVPEPADLAGWSAAERAHNDLFLGMYEVWAQAA